MIINQILFISIGYLIILTAIFGKNFSYISFGPVYITEIVMLISAVTFFTNKKVTLITRSKLSILICAFFIFNSAYIPNSLASNGINALRDSAIWYYSIFALLIFSLGIRDDIVLNIKRYIDLLAYSFIIGSPMFYFITNYMGIFQYILKAGDTLVFMGIGFGWLTYIRKKLSLSLTVVTIFLAMAIGATNRAGLIAFLIITFLPIMKLIKTSKYLTVLPLIFTFGLIFYVSGISFSSNTNGREISGKQIMRNIESVFLSTNDQTLDGSKEWRISWWQDIYREAGPRGDRALVGLGYGINLADYYGYQVSEDSALRSPHSIWMNYLARTGTVGLCFFLIINIYLILSLAAKFFIMRDEISGWLLFSLLGILANASLDVYLENPIGALTYWGSIGICLINLRSNTFSNIYARKGL